MVDSRNIGSDGGGFKGGNDVRWKLFGMVDSGNIGKDGSVLRSWIMSEVQLMWRMKL